MTVKKVKKENAKTRYDAKNPPVSFRVSIEERKRLNELRKDGTTYRNIILKGAGMVEREKVNKKRQKDEEGRRIQEVVVAAKNEALRKMQLGKCRACGKPLFWDLTKSDIRSMIGGLINERGYCHHECLG